MALLMALLWYPNNDTILRGPGDEIEGVGRPKVIGTQGVR